MRKILICILLLTVCAVSVFAQEDYYGANKLEDALSPEQKSLLEDAGPTEPTDFFSHFGSIVVQSVLQSESALKRATGVLGGVIAVLILCSVVERFEIHAAKRTAQFAGVFAVTLLCTGSMHSMLGLAKQMIEELRGFQDVLLPVMSATLAASGAPTAAAGLFAGTVLFMDILQRILSDVFVPLVYAYLAISCGECAMDESLRKIREFIGFLISVGLKGVMYLYTAYLAITEIVGKGTDAAALKAAKATISAAIPVVGSVASGAGESILAGAQMLKNTAGVFGMLAIVSIGIGPFIQIGLHYLTLKVGTAIGGTLSKEGTGKMTERICEAMGYMLAISGCGILMALISCCCFLRSGNG